METNPEKLSVIRETESVKTKEVSQRDTILQGAIKTTLDGESEGERPVSGKTAFEDKDLALKLDSYSLEAVVELKISRFLDQIGTYYPDNLHELIMKKVDKPLLSQILRRVGGNQVHAARILGINRNTLRKKMRGFGL